MGQPPCRNAAIPCFVSLICLLCFGCDSRNSPVATTQSNSVRIASLSPAATDLLINMGAADHLQAVSNFDAAEINGRTLPRVGDYQNTDWETLASLHLQAMIIQMDPGRLSPAFADNAKRMGIKLIDVRLNTIADILSESRELATAVGEPAKGEQLAQHISQQIDAVKKRCEPLPKIRALLTLTPQSDELIGVGEFLNEALTAAGGINVAASLGGAYPTADPEMLAKLQPDVVILLQPNAKPEALQQTKDLWAKLEPDAQHMPKVFVLNRPYVQLPGAHVGDIAGALADCLHGAAKP